MQLAATLSLPSANHSIFTRPRVKSVSLIVVGAAIQSSRPACSAQNPSGSSTERA